MIQIIAAVLAVFGVVLLLRSLWIRTGLTPRQTLWTVLALTGILALIALAATGRLNWIIAAAAALLPFVRRLGSLLSLIPILNRLFPGWHTRFQKRPGPSPGPDQSSTETDLLRMTLDHGSGEMDGEVKHGPYQGRRLSEMSANQMMALMAAATDYDSQRLIESYLDRRHPGWRDARSPDPERQTAMSRSDALEILGLSDGASTEEIVAAHRRLIQRLHPDRGGSTYLAAQINAAKKLLMKS